MIISLPHINSPDYHSQFQEAKGQPLDSSNYDQKNIRRRVYDALNVLMAMNIISKDKKEIRWIGLPTNSVQVRIHWQAIGQSSYDLIASNISLNFFSKHKLHTHIKTKKCMSLF